MTFNSLAYLIFFPTVAAVYYLLPFRLRWAFLLLASCFFYIYYIPVYIFVLLGLICVDYSLAIGIEGSKGRIRNFLLILSILSTCSILFIFKYFNFFNENIGALAQALHWNYSIKHLSLLLPLGLSFHTFQSLAYVIEVYKGNQKAERHFGIYALYVMFFPQLVAGPIERPQHLLPQFYQKHPFNYRQITDGLKMIAWGMFKKVVIADNLAGQVDAVFDHPHDPSGTSYFVAAVFFAFQIYCDFSGYSDIAIGSAEVMGFRLIENFNRPFFSRSMVEYWQRWHISLSSWLRDYLFYPLFGNNISVPNLLFNIMIVFLVCGLWHGANWTFIAWGLINGIYIVFGLATKNFKKKAAHAVGLTRYPQIYALLQILTNFLLVCFVEIFFRAHTLTDAFFIIGHLFSKLNLVQWTPQFIWNITLILSLVAVEIVQKKGGIRQRLAVRPAWIRWTVYYSFATTILLSLYLRDALPEPFIYYKF
jgi:alginate O-acetyltransferase complex protein AlgI